MPCGAHIMVESSYTTDLRRTVTQLSVGATCRQWPPGPSRLYNMKFSVPAGSLIVILVPQSQTQQYWTNVMSRIRFLSHI